NKAKEGTLMIGRRLAAIFIVFACLLSASPARTQPYPTRPITIVIPFPAGGSADTLARLIGQQLNERLGQAVVVENKPGAGGNPLAIMDVIAGHVPVFFDFVLTGLPHVREGKVRALATTGAHRSKVLPDVPTVMEAGVPDFEASTWFALYAPAGIKPAIVEKL